MTGRNLKTCTIDNLTLTVGRSYKGNNGVGFTVTDIWSDRDGIMVSYRCDDGALGDSTPNSLYWWING